MGARLQAIRVERGVTKAGLGRLAGITAPSITQIENGGQSGVEVIEALAQALGVSPGWLAFGVGPQVLPSRRRSRQVAQHAEPEP
jgi:transcriptional regulator with XRE-family HTH domain